MTKINKIFQSNWFWLFFATNLLLFYTTVLSLKVLVIVLWFILFAILRITKLETKLSLKEQNIYLTTVFLYPIIGIWIQWMMVKNIIPYSWFWLNRLEHFATALGVVIIFLPIFIDIWRECNWWQNLILVVGFICLIGNINEFVEFYLRWDSKSIDTKLSKSWV